MEVFEIVVKLLLMFVPVLVLLKWVHKQIVIGTEREELSKFREALLILDQISYSVVASAEQALAKQLRILVKSGEAPRGQLLDIANVVFEDIVKYTKPEVLKILEGKIDTDKYIKDLIEAKVLEVKKLE